MLENAAFKPIRAVAPGDGEAEICMALDCCRAHGVRLWWENPGAEATGMISELQGGCKLRWECSPEIQALERKHRVRIAPMPYNLSLIHI